MAKEEKNPNLLKYKATKLKKRTEMNTADKEI